MQNRRLHTSLKSSGYSKLLTLYRQITEKALGAHSQKETTALPRDQSGSQRGWSMQKAERSQVGLDLLVVKLRLAMLEGQIGSTSGV